MLCTNPINRDITVNRDVCMADLNSYRPVSSLSYVSKILERLIDSRVTDHASRHGLFSLVQSANHKYHSIETVLVEIHRLCWYT